MAISGFPRKSREISEKKTLSENFGKSREISGNHGKLREIPEISIVFIRNVDRIEHGSSFRTFVALYFSLIITIYSILSNRTWQVTSCQLLSKTKKLFYFSTFWSISA